MLTRTVVVTGGAGFIGVNAAEAFIRDGWHVILFDNLSRKGTDLNLRYLQQSFPTECEFVLGDIRYDYFPLLHAVGRAELVLHLAAQVAVTTSMFAPPRISRSTPEAPLMCWRRFVSRETSR